MARGSANQLARIHAMWTLEGLAALDVKLVRELMKSPDPQIRIQAIRASETLYKDGDKSFAADYRAMVEDSDPNVVIQAMLTMNLQKVPDAGKIIAATVAASPIRGVKEIGGQILKPAASLGQRPSLADTAVGFMNLSADQRKSLLRGEGVYKELCASCHGPDGKGAPMAGGAEGATLAPPLSGSPRVQAHREYVIKVLLNGLTGPVGDKNYSGGVMVPMGTNTDQWLADVASYVRSSFGNTAGVIAPEDVTAVRKMVTRKTPWTLAELLPTVPAPLTNTSEWKVSASHNAAAAANVVAPATPGARWDSGAPQQPGMWFQIELPQAYTVAGLQIDSVATGGGRGRGGRGGGPPAGGPVAFNVQVSTDGATWQPPVAEGAGSTPTTMVTLPRVQARFIRINQTGTAANGQGWGIQQLRVLVVEGTSTVASSQ